MEICHIFGRKIKGVLLTKFVRYYRRSKPKIIKYDFCAHAGVFVTSNFYSKDATIHIRLGDQEIQLRTTLCNLEWLSDKIQDVLARSGRPNLKVEDK